ncbi:MAG: hypothetical protein GY851_29700, partial [bacterium]|nr:hypothetical protein [bacterium]
MMGRKATTALLAVAVCYAVCVPAQFRVDAIKGGPTGAAGHQAIDDELLYLPNEKLLIHFTGGMGSVVADLLWLQCIQYTSKHFRGDRKFTWLNHMCGTITRLDPYFGDVYRYGGVFLAALEADDDASIDLLRAGIPQAPKRWELPYEMAVVYLLNRRDQPGSHEMAARCLAMAVATGTAPEALAGFARDLQRRHNLEDVERAMWIEMAENAEDKIMRDMAAHKLTELTLRDNCKALNQAVALFKERQRRSPSSLEELVSGGILASPIPADPLGGRYILDSDGIVKNTTLLDEQFTRRMNRLR